MNIKLKKTLTALILMLLTVGSLTAATVTWKAATTGDWDTATNWQGDTAPTNGDDVVITAGAAILSSTSFQFGSVTVTNGILMFTNWTTCLNATNVFVWNGGTLTIPAAYTNNQMSNRVNVLCTSFFLDAGANINVDSCGYAGAAVVTTPGNGPGRGVVIGNRPTGPSHGGRGGFTDSRLHVGATPYDTPAAPTAPGSGGASGSLVATPPGGNGGGAVRIAADGGTVAINGTISANGTDTAARNASPGSGGAIYISCAAFAGTGGVLRANGGNNTGTTAGGGGGGCIAVIYGTAVHTGMTFQVRGGTGKHSGDIGTLYFSDSSLLGPVLADNMCGQVLNLSSWGPRSLFISNTWIRFPSDGFQLIVTNDLVISGSGGRLDIGADRVLAVYTNNADEIRGWYLYYNSGSVRPSVNVGGDLIVTNRGLFAMYSVGTNAGVTEYGALVSVTGNVVCASNSWIYPVSNPTNGGSPYFKMGGLAILTNGGVNADYCGFKGWTGYGKGNTDSRGSGGGYGGVGGKTSYGTAAGGTNYGSALAPVNCGSGGGVYSSGNLDHPGGRGGGLFRASVRGDVVLAGGTISAKGEYDSNADGGGSGGGIYLSCRRLGGNGTITATGGSVNVTVGGGGGGGRIAVWRGRDETLGLMTNANGGTGYSNGWVGTIVMGGLPELGFSPNGVAIPVENNITTNLEFSLWNSGLDTNDLYWTASSITPWMTFSNSGVITAGQTNTLIVTNNCIGLTPGWYTGVVTFVSTSAVSYLNPEPIQTNLTIVLGVYAGSPTPTVQFQSVTSSGDESVTPAAMTVVLDTPTPQAVTVNYEAIGGSATGGGEDYTLVSGTLTINPGTISSNIYLTVVDDLQDENAEETVVVTLSNAVNATVGTASNYTYTILDNDVARWITGSGTSNWFDSANWSGGFLPVEGNDVVIMGAGATILLTNATPVLNSLTMTNGTLIFSNMEAVVRASDVRITGGTVRHVANSDSSSVGGWAIIGRVYFSCTNFYLGTNATIDVNMRGWGAPTANSAGYGEGLGGARAGAGYGGFGGNFAKLGGQPYGVTEAPDKPGSGGGGYIGVSGGLGGGLVRIEAPGGTATVHGVISANGSAGGASAGGGSGGGIYISCRTLAGSGGSITANGGDRNGTSGAGGGGRIAVAYDPQAQSNAPACSITFSARMGAAPYYLADLGTLWFPDNTLLGETVRHTGQWMAPVNVWAPDKLTVLNGLIRFPAAGMQLSVTGDVTVTGTGAGLELGGNASMGNTMFRGGIYQNFMLFSAMASPPEMRVGGDLTLTNGGLLRLYGAPTNGSPHGALLAVTGNLVVASSSALYPVSDPTNGGSLRIVANNLSVLSSGTINADTAGFGPGRVTVSGEEGFGEGGGGSRAGGGYGGFGGNYSDLGGRIYGDAQAPRRPGSGGGNTAALSGGPGGGLIWIEAAGWIRVDGILTANGGTSASGALSGGGSGGGIHLTCQSFASAGGTISANGATPSDDNTGSGGGGRISIEYNPGAQAAADPVNVTLLASAGYALYLGDLGTVYLPDSQLLRENMNVEGQIMGFPSWNPNELLVNNRRARFIEDGFALTVSNNLTIDGATALLELGGGNIFPRGSYWDKVNGETPVDNNLTGLIKYSAETAALTCGGNLVLTNGGDMGIYSGPTNTSGGWGALVDIKGDVTIGTNSWIFPMSNPTNGGSALFKMKNLAIPMGNAGFNAHQGGFAGGGGSRPTGYGPGAATAANQGGGYGGVGGTNNGSMIPGATYGSSNAPIDPGSGGGRSGTTTTSMNSGGAGGGLIRLEITETLLLGGQLRANGRYGSATRFSGGGSGGGINVRCRTISGGGSLTANGGNGLDVSTYGASGGGGRIAVHSVYSNGWSGSATVNPGTARVTMLGATGTVVWVQATEPIQGTIFTLR